MQAVDCPDQVKTIYNVLFWTGIRIGELLALTLNDFDFDKCTLRINKTYTRHKKTDLIQDPKTEKSNRTISIPLFLKEDINTHISKLYDYSPDERLFNIYKDAIGYYIDKYSPIAGVHRIRVHDLRHSHASLLINLGEPPLLIQERLGHENIETTLNTYSHLYPNQQAKLADKLQQTFINSTISVR
ncbi:putative prophage phiRv2 integrase [Anaerotignum neopropionicum]|uniref:Putative prophage phiRv2 integrase n=2 Tax=Anaerotignum neopropionicum TaxID=36847 RepID=A0A136WBH0_9FIRM|nr:putative prophage phiRv2 integrase [Anaerotignum neopropionicum]